MNRAKAEEITAKVRNRLSARYKSTITEWQLESQKGLAVQDPSLSLSQVTFDKPPDDGVLQALLLSIKRLGDGTETFAVPEVQPVEAEWLSEKSSLESGNGNNTRSFECIGKRLTVEQIQLHHPTNPLFSSSTEAPSSIALTQPLSLAITVSSRAMTY